MKRDTPVYLWLGTFILLPYIWSIVVFYLFFTRFLKFKGLFILGYAQVVFTSCAFLF